MTQSHLLLRRISRESSAGRNRFYAVSLVAAVAVWLGTTNPVVGAAQPDQPRRPNILFIMVDDLGPEWLSCYGSEELETPHLDALAAGGMRFVNAYSMPKCTPTRVTLLTGQYPFRHGWIGHWDVPRWGGGCHFDWKHNTTFARVLKSAGYATAAAGKWQINDFRVHPDCMRRHGFDEWAMWTGFETGVPASAERYWDPYINTNGVSKTHRGRFGTDVWAEFLIDFMRRHRSQPMLLYFPMALTHTPFTTTPSRPDVKGRKARHKAMVTYVDDAVGRLIAALEELGLRDRTIVFFTTDNGTTRRISGRMNGRQVQGGKDTFGENGMRAPFLVNCPGVVPEGVVTEALTDFTDILPTFADLAGAELPADAPIDGRSFAKHILGQADDSPRKWILAMGNASMIRTPEGVHFPKPVGDRVIRNKRYKLWSTDGQATALYDLHEDPAEEQNLIDSAAPEHVAARTELAAVLKSLPPDARPKYDPLPPQPWDKPVATEKGEK